MSDVEMSVAEALEKADKYGGEKMPSVSRTLAAEVRSLQEIEKDAARYQHWKNALSEDQEMRVPHDVFLLMEHLDIDEAFDEAIEAQKGPQSHQK